ncbi:MAG: sulfatase-like hydrolase/transferase, partial [Myxococcota bacterium]
AFVLERRFGLGRGFAVYDDETVPTGFPGGMAERRGDATTERAIEWLRKPRDRPFFLWVHYYDPHADYAPPPPFDTRYDHPYDGEIAFVDDQIGRLLEAVRASNDHGEVVVVTADHAEAFGEHGEWSHGFLVQEATLRIPLILYASRGLPRSVHVTSRASQVDLVPTLLAGLGIPVPPGLDGADLARLPQGDRAVLAEAAEGRARYGWARLGVIYRGSLKYVAGPIPELYDLAEDPLERDNVVAQRAGEAERLARQLASLEAGGGDVLDPGGVALDPDDLQRLQALGYALGAGTEPAPARADAPDPKQMMPVMVRIQSLVTDFGIDPELPLWRRLAAWLNGRPFIASRADLIRAFEELAAEHPDYGPAWDYLAGLYREEGRLEDAGEAQRRADAAR